MTTKFKLPSWPRKCSEAQQKHTQVMNSSSHPPMPSRCGCVTLQQSSVAIAASTADPRCLSAANPAEVLHPPSSDATAPCGEICLKVNILN